MRTTCLLLILLALPLSSTARSEEKAAPVAESALREAIERSLPLLTAGARGHREQRTCFACHSQGLPILAMVTARGRGLTIEEEELAEQVKFIAEFLERNQGGYLEGKGQGGQADTAGYALVALELAGREPDAITAAVTSYLLQRNADTDRWRANSRRPPSEGSDFTTTYVALRGLTHFGTEEQREPIEKRRAEVLAWLLKAEPREHEDRVFRLLGLHAAKAADDVLEAAAQELLKRQRADGGWAQLDGGEPAAALESDPYATATALVALHWAAGLPTEDSAYQHGLRFLLETQQADGSWHVASRSKPFQKYFETGYPHGTDQFISSAAGGWATTAFGLALPVSEETEEESGDSTAN